MEDEPLPGGLANAGQVVRRGEHVVRPAGPDAASVHAFLRAIAATGFDGAPRPVDLDTEAGRERLTFVDGDVPAVPYPAWSQSDAALASIARLVRALHDASAAFDHRPYRWRDTLADPTGGPIVCHNDVELGNVVFRDGEAVALIDFEFAAPGRPTYDLANLIRLCVPIEHEVDRDRMAWRPADHPSRARLVADAYGLDRIGRGELAAAIDDAIDRVEGAARRQFDLAEASAADLLARTGGIEKYDRRRRWWVQHRPSFAAALA